MLKKHALCALALLCSTPIFANIPIESHNLSQSSARYANSPAIATSNMATANVPTNINWQLMQKNAMTSDFCWKTSAQKYLDVYKTL